MKFAIIIPTLNEAANIVNCLAPLQCLRYCCEIIVVDGGSSDATSRLAEAWCDVLLTSPPGRARQMNLGAQQASSDVLIFLHADTLLPTNALQLIEESFNSTRQWGRFNIKLTGKHVMLTVIAFFMNWRSRLTGIATGDQAIFISKRWFDDVGQFPLIPLMEDIALCKQLKKISPPICITAPAISSGRRWEQFGVIKTILLMWRLRLRYFFGDDPQALADAYKAGRLWKL